MCFNTNIFFAFTDKLYCVTLNIFLKIHYKIFCFLKCMTILIHTNCVHYHVVFWTGYCDCVHHGLKCVLKSLRTYVYFTRLQEEKYFCSNKMFTSRKLQVARFFFFFYAFSIKWHHKHMYCEQRKLAVTTRDCISHPNTHAHTHVYMFSDIFTGILEEFCVSVNWSCRKQVSNESLLSNWQIAQFVITDESNDYSHHYLTS